MSGDDKAKKGFQSVASVSGGAAGVKVGRTGDTDVDKALDLMDAEGFQLRSMVMPPGATVMVFEQPEKQMAAIILYKRAGAPLEIADGRTLTESHIAIAPFDADSNPAEDFIPLRRYLAEREAGTRRALHTLRLH